MPTELVNCLFTGVIFQALAVEHIDMTIHLALLLQLFGDFLALLALSAFETSKFLLLQ
jgi:hypothetical protein